MEYLFAFQFLYCKLCVKNRWTGREGAESNVLLIFVLWGCFACRWERGCRLGQKVLFRSAVISSFSSRDLSRRNKRDWFWIVVSTGYFYILFLWAIVVSDFPPFKIHKHLVLPLSSITFTVNSQADNYFYKYKFICFSCFKYYTVIMVYRKNWKWSAWYISNGLQKKLFIEKNRFFSVDYVKINELHVVHIWRHMQSEYMK